MATAFRPGQPWLDTDGAHINAHGGGVLYEDGVYYWFGEKRAQTACEGVSVYASRDLLTWENHGLALDLVDGEPEHDLARGCIVERPKVLRCPATGRCVMWFHHELRGQGYHAARAGVAVSDTPTGPYTFLASFRPNGNMSRDMTLYQDNDGSAYHVYASRDNYDLRVCRLAEDFLSPTEDDHCILPGQHREAPALFKHEGRYYLITSGCTGWAPNLARLHTADSAFGPWSDLGSPMHGSRADSTFGAQSTFVLPVQGLPGALVFMADLWVPTDLRNSLHVWLPIDMDGGRATIEWLDEWDLGWFETR